MVGGEENCGMFFFKKNIVFFFLAVTFNLRRDFLRDFWDVLKLPYQFLCRVLWELDEFESWKLTVTEVFNISDHPCMVYLPASG